MKKILLWTMVLASVLLAKCGDPLKDSTYTMYDKLPLGQYLESKPEFTEWTKLLKHSGMYNALNVKEQFTVFVQRNEVLLDYLKKQNYASVEEMSVEDAANLVRYHVIQGKLYKHSAFVDGRIADSTASGDYLITGYGDAGINSIILNKEAKIVERDIETVNAIVHVLDKTLAPVTQTLWDFLNTNEQYSIFRDAVKLTGLDAKLSEVRQVKGKMTIRVYSTLFAVNNQVFADGSNIHNIDELVAKLSAGRTDYTNAVNPLYAYVAYHILSEYYSYTDLGDFGKSTSKLKNMNTYAPNELMCVEDYKGELLINRHENNAIRMTVYNQQSKNGIIHDVDNMMPVYTPEPTKVAFDVTSGSEFKVLDIYGITSGAGTKTHKFEEESISYMRWNTVPSGVGTVNYEIRNTFGDFINWDVLTVNLGSVGWIEIDIPTIVKGKYKISVKHHRGPNRGTYQPFLDGNRLGSPVVFQAGGFSYPLTNMGTVNFVINSTHTIKFVVVNPGIMEIDRIEFEPIQ